MARIKMHIPKAKLPFYPPYEVKYRLQNGVSTSSCKEDLVDVLLKLQKSSDLKFEITTKHIKAVTSVCLNLALAILSVFQL